MLKFCYVFEEFCGRQWNILHGFCTKSHFLSEWPFLQNIPWITECNRDWYIVCEIPLAYVYALMSACKSSDSVRNRNQLVWICFMLKVLIHSPHTRSQRGMGPIVASSENDISLLNINQQVSSVCAGKLHTSNMTDVLVVGTQTNLIAYDVDNNSDLFYKDVRTCILCFSVFFCYPPCDTVCKGVSLVLGFPSFARIC